MLLIATGAQVGESLDAVKLLKEKGIDAGVLNVSSIKPLDERALVKILKDYKAVMTVEQHSVLNGLGSAVSEIIAQNNIDIKFKRHGLQDIFTTSGPYTELLAYYKLDPEGICQTVFEFLNRV
jgi:transketolase